MNNGRTRSSLMAIVAVYLLHQAYQLYQGRNDPTSSMSPAVAWIFIVFFAAAAAGLVVYACRLWKHAAREEAEEKQEEEDGLKG